MTCLVAKAMESEMRDAFTAIGEMRWQDMTAHFVAGALLAPVLAACDPACDRRPAGCHLCEECPECGGDDYVCGCKTCGDEGYILTTGEKT